MDKLNILVTGGAGYSGSVVTAHLVAADHDVVVLDARRFDEFQTMCIPGGTSVPGAELALRVRDLAPDPRTRVIVNCAGRTRSIIGTQSLVNAGIPNPVAALRNGTIGWTLAGFGLAHGQQRRFGEASAEHRDDARRAEFFLQRRGKQHPFGKVAQLHRPGSSCPGINQDASTRWE